MLEPHEPMDHPMDAREEIVEKHAQHMHMHTYIHMCRILHCRTIHQLSCLFSLYTYFVQSSMGPAMMRSDEFVCLSLASKRRRSSRAHMSMRPQRLVQAYDASQPVGRSVGRSVVKLVDHSYLLAHEAKCQLCQHASIEPRCLLSAQRGYCLTSTDPRDGLRHIYYRHVCSRARCN